MLRLGRVSRSCHGTVNSPIIALVFLWVGGRFICRRITPTIVLDLPFIAVLCADPLLLLHLYVFASFGVDTFFVGSVHVTSLSSLHL